jgi:hypothetical protein
MTRPNRPEALDWVAAHDPLRLVPLADPMVEALGHDPRSTYAELFWLPILGPSTLWTLRRVAAGFDACPAGFDLPLARLGGELGLTGGVTRNGPTARTITRLVEFDMARIVGDGLAVRRKLPPLPRRHVLRLPPHLAERHRALLEATLQRREPDRVAPVVTLQHLMRDGRETAPGDLTSGRAGEVGEGRLPARTSAHRPC